MFNSSTCKENQFYLRKGKHLSFLGIVKKSFGQFRSEWNPSKDPFLPKIRDKNTTTKTRIMNEWLVVL